jgi:diguanylate cyclase (GGDEF)-like protein
MRVVAPWLAALLVTLLAALLGFAWLTSAHASEAAQVAFMGVMSVVGLGLALVIASTALRLSRERIKGRDGVERRLARLTEIYSALGESSQLILRVADRHHLFDELCRICVRSGGLDLVAVGTYEASPNHLELVASHGAHQQFLQRLVESSVAETAACLQPARRALEEGRALVLNQSQHSGGAAASDDQAKPPFRSMAAFPVRCGEEIVAALCLFSAQEGFFDERTVGLLDQLADGVSLALENLRREDARRYQASVLTDQNRILNLVASGADLTLIFTTLAQFVETHSDGGTCSMVALDQKGSQYSLGVAPSMPEGYDRAVIRISLEAAAGPCAEVIRSRSPLVVSDLDSYPLDAPLRDFIDQADLHSVSAWPILGNKGQVLGALALYSRRRGVPSEVAANLISICTDLAGIAIESRRAAERIRHLAHHDELTGLPNRLLFNQQLTRALVRARRVGGSVGLLFLDLDRFKVINDTLGHSAGDEALCQVTESLLHCLRKSDSLARVGGDEFTLLVDQFEDPQTLVEIAQKLLGAAAKTMTINGQECHLSGSIGISIYPDDGKDGASLLKNADIAMYRAKSSGRNNYQFYSKEMNEHSVERLALESQLRQAVARREFVVHYQPKVSIATGKIAGAEALVRWQHPERGLLAPGEFIGIAEEVGLIASIGRLVLETACVDAKAWFARGAIPIRIAINLSAQQFESARLIEDLDRVLKDTGFDPCALEFEITESVVMTNPEQALVLLEQIKTRGITLAIDDFGTGHSSLAYLKRFPVDSVKIDRAFVRDISEDSNDLAITKAIVAMGQSMGLRVIAEGVENAVQLEILRSVQCDEFQGFLFSRGVPAAEFERLLELHGEGGARTAPAPRIYEAAKGRDYAAPSAARNARR